MTSKQKQYFSPELKAKQKTLDHRKKELKKKATPSEIRIYSLLKSIISGRVIFQKGLIKGNLYCIVDFYIPSLGLCIEVDGGYHNTPEQQRKDAYRDSYILKERKMSVLRIPNAVADTISSDDVDRLLKGDKLLGCALIHWKSTVPLTRI